LAKKLQDVNERTRQRLIVAIRKAVFFFISPPKLVACNELRFCNSKYGTIYYYFKVYHILLNTTLFSKMSLHIFFTEIGKKAYAIN